MPKNTKTLKDLKVRAKKEWWEKQSETKKEDREFKKLIARTDRLDKINEKNSKLPYKIINKGGRPTKYKLEYAKQLIDYFDKRSEWWYFEEYVIEEHVGKNWELKEKIWLRVKPLPTMVSFAVNIGIDETTLINWCTAKDNNWKLKYPEFFKSYKYWLSIQKTWLNELGATWHYNSNIVKFLLQNDHAMFETITEQNQTDLWKKKNEINEANIDNELSEFYK